MTRIAAMLAELDQESRTTRRVLERVPDDRLDWRPHERSFTLGQLAMHVATIPGAIADIASRPSFDFGSGIPRPGATGAAQLVAALDESVARAHAILGGMDDSSLGERWSGVAGDKVLMTIPRGVLLRTTMLNHWYHHRGQLTVYLRQLDVPVPSIYGPSADEALF